MRELAAAPPDELVQQGSEDAYPAMGQELSWDLLGTPVVENDLFSLRDDPGTLEDENWLRLQWSRPEDETTPCW